jgi:hypothetical protein
MVYTSGSGVFEVGVAGQDFIRERDASGVNPQRRGARDGLALRKKGPTFTT